MPSDLIALACLTMIIFLIYIVIFFDSRKVQKNYPEADLDYWEKKLKADGEPE